MENNDEIMTLSEQVFSEYEEKRIMDNMRK